MSDWLKNFEESSGEIRLSEYVDRNEATWRQANVDFLNKLLTNFIIKFTQNIEFMLK